MWIAALALALSTGSAAPAPPEPLFRVERVLVGDGSGTVLLADLNNDGELDMVTRHLQRRSIAVLPGQSRGRFGPGRTFTLPYAPGDMKLGDLNEDGVLDLAITDAAADIVEVISGDVRRGFLPAARVRFTVTDAIDALNKRTLHLTDLDADGHLDIVTANGRRRNTFGVLRGDGRGGFTPGRGGALEYGRDRYWYAFGDIDGDGRLDAVTVSTSSDAPGATGRLLVQPGDGHGVFARTHEPFELAGAPGGLALADLNGDARLDVAVAHADGQLSLLLNTGGGRLAAGPSSPLRLGARAYALTLADVNQDARIDIVAATEDTVTVVLATDAGYQSAPGSPFPAGPGAYNLALGDVNKDGKLDVASSSFGGNAVTILLGR